MKVWEMISALSAMPAGAEVWIDVWFGDRERSVQSVAVKGNPDIEDGVDIVTDKKQCSELYYECVAYEDNNPE